MIIKSELQRTILLFLTEKDMTGYEMMKSLMSSRVWSSRHQQIYRELNALKAAGHVHFNLVAQEGKPDKKVYSLSDIGRCAVSMFSKQTDVKEIAYHSESTVMLKAGNPRYFLALKDKLTVDIEALELELPKIEDEIEYAIAYRQLSLMKAEYQYADAALVTIESINYQQQQQLSEVA
ncbi:PadR family transcriptional regulator [Photobacterium leiognathi]|uniref:PadR family transcriptional regulator n=1 Tax=Photobacterium leiognathi TaxID=553611 RepID=UPI001EDFB6AE|nr:PadR family transcriptional regulator [Photobacterium leiognathi]MCG3884131.1 PadR family transcriptional regulator [Photobacterium leiognathi]